MSEIQTDLLAPTIDQRFDAWMETAGGKQCANDFIRLALYCKNIKGKRIGQRAIWEKLRWEYEVERTDHDYKLNDHFTSRMVRFVESRVPELIGYFEKRELGTERRTEKKTITITTERKVA